MFPKVIRLCLYLCYISRNCGYIWPCKPCWRIAGLGSAVQIQIISISVVPGSAANLWWRCWQLWTNKSSSEHKQIDIKVNKRCFLFSEWHSPYAQPSRNELPLMLSQRRTRLYICWVNGEFLGQFSKKILRKLKFFPSWTTKVLLIQNLEHKCVIQGWVGFGAFADIWSMVHGPYAWLPMHQMQRSWVRLAQWNRRGGIWSSVEYSTKKSKNPPPPKKKINKNKCLMLVTFYGKCLLCTGGFAEMFVRWAVLGRG
jgi:hypothetical protein